MGEGEEGALCTSIQNSKSINKIGGENTTEILIKTALDL